jgi:cubilin
MSHFRKSIVYFFKRPSFQNAGWKAKYTVYRCGGEITSPGRIQSPGHPFTSAPNMNCTWRVRGPVNSVVRFKFEMLELEFASGCWHDYVKLYDGDGTTEQTLLGTFCGNMTEDLHRISSKSNVMTVQFLTDWSIQYGGFAGSVDFSAGEGQGCGGAKNLTAAGTTLTIQSVDTDNNGQYDSYLDCQWLVSGPDFQALEISFNSFNVEGRQAMQGKNVSEEDCPYDFLEIRDGPGPYSQLLGKFCGSGIPPAVSSSMNFMWIRFVTDGTNNFPGFRARITNKECKCGT